MTAVTFRRGDETFDIECERLVVADGVRSGLGKVLGREWHQDTVYAVAGRCYVDSAQSDDPWISSHLELRSETGEALPGYGWIFPLGGGQVNVGVGALATTKRPADVAIKPLMRRYTDERRADFGLTGEQRMPTSALLPMGGAVSNVAGANWALIGDAAACVNPLNGEGIDYGLETGRLVVDHLDDDLAAVWPALLARPLRRGVLDRPPAGRHLHRPAHHGRARPGRHAQRLADDPRAALDGQPRHRRGPRPLGPDLALGRPPLASRSTRGPPSPDIASSAEVVAPATDSRTHRQEQHGSSAEVVALATVSALDRREREVGRWVRRGPVR